MAEEVKVNVVQIETGESVDNLKKLKSEIKKLKSDLLGLNEGSKEYNETLSQLADAQFKMKDIQEKSQRAMMDTGEILANVSGLAGTATSAMAGFQGVLQLVGDESDEMQKLTQNIISLMAVAQSFSAIEDGIDRFKNLKIAIAGATKGLSKFKLALGGLGIGVAVAAIGVLISQLSKLNEKQRETKQHFTDLADAMGEDVVKFELLQSAWKDLGDDIKAKEQFIVDNKDKFNDLGFAVLSVVDAEKLLVQNSSAVVGAIEARADAEIYYKDFVEKRKAKLEADKKYFDELARYQSGETKNPYKKDRANDAMLEANAEYDTAKQLYTESQKKLQEFVKTIGVATTEQDKNTESTNNNNTAVKEEVETLEDYLEILQQINQEKMKTVAEPNNDLRPFDADEDKENKQGKIDDLQNDSDIQTLKAKTAMMNSLIEASEKEKKEILENWALEDLKIQESENVRQMEILDLSHTYGLLSEEEYQRQKHELLYQGSQISVSIAEEEAKKIEEKREGIKQGLKMIYDQVPQLLGAIQGTLDTSSKKGFETNKKIEKTQATLNYLSSMGGAYKSVMNSGIPVPYNFVVLATVLGMVTATFAANMKKINNLKFNGGGASIGGGTSPSMPSISDSAVNALNKPNIGNTRLTFSEGDIENLPAQKVYVLSSEIEDSLNMRKTTIRNSTF